jgi:hypothetical protein
MKQLEPTHFPKHLVGWESMVRGLHEASLGIGFTADRIDVVGQSFWVQQSCGAYNF